MLTYMLNFSSWIQVSEFTCCSYFCISFLKHFILTRKLFFFKWVFVALVQCLEWCCENSSFLFLFALFIVIVWEEVGPSYTSFTSSVDPFHGTLKFMKNWVHLGSYFPFKLKEVILLEIVFLDHSQAMLSKWDALRKKRALWSNKFFLLNTSWSFSEHLPH